MRPELKETITNLGLEYRLMTQFTSFVAVEEMIVTDGGTPRRIDVPVEVPEGVSRDHVFSDAEMRPSGTLQSLNYVGLMASKTVSQSVEVTSSPGGSKAKRERAGKRGVGVGTGGGTGPGRGGNIGGGDVNVGGGGPGGSGTGGATPQPSPRAAPGRMVLTDDVNYIVNSPGDEKRQQLLTKLQPSLLAVVERLQRKEAKPGADELKFVRDGKAEVQIWLIEKSAEALAELKKLGFEIILDPKTAKLVIGRLPIENLEKLAELKSVRYVAPQRG
jgi:hypothetical protein